MAAEQDAWVLLRQTLLERWGFEKDAFRIESPLTAPGFPDIIAFKDGKTWFVELKAWDLPLSGFHEKDVPWRPGQQVQLRKLARKGDNVVAAVLCCLKVARGKRVWLWGMFDAEGGVSWVEQPSGG